MRRTMARRRELDEVERFPAQVGVQRLSEECADEAVAALWRAVVRSTGRGGGEARGGEVGSEG